MNKDTAYFVDEMLTKNIKLTESKKKDDEFDSADDMGIKFSKIDKVKKVINTTKSVSNHLMNNWRKYALGGVVAATLAKAGYNKYKGI